MSSANSQTATDTDTSNAGPSASKPTPLSIQESEQGNPPAHAARFACIDLCNFDCIRLANFTASEIADVNRVITENWHKGIRKSRRYGESREIQLYGLSWMGSASGHDESRLLVLRILENLYNKGWMLQSAVNIIKEQKGKEKTDRERTWPFQVLFLQVWSILNPEADNPSR